MKKKDCNKHVKVINNSLFSLRKVTRCFRMLLYGIKATDYLTVS